MNFTIGLISQELSCELFIVLYLHGKYPVAHWLYSRISRRPFVCPTKFCISIVSSFSWDLQWFGSQKFGAQS